MEEAVIPVTPEFLETLSVGSVEDKLQGVLSFHDHVGLAIVEAAMAARKPPALQDKIQVSGQGLSRPR